MNQKLLTILGCSGSLAIAGLSTNNPAMANSIEEYVFNAPGMEEELVEIPRSETDYPFADCSCSLEDEEMIEKRDREGDKAIELYGCDCAGCRNLVRTPQIQNNLTSQK